MLGLKTISCVLMRGGTSKGPFFLKESLPSDVAERDKLLLSLMGSPHSLQIDGIGGSQPQSSKVAIISRSSRKDADVDYLFAQVSIDKKRVDTNPNCGNMLAAVGPYAIEKGLLPAKNGSTTVRIFNENTKTLIHSRVQTPNAQVTYDGNFKLDGVPGKSAPVCLDFFNAEGAKTGQLFPTGQRQEMILGKPATLIDYSMPMMLLDCRDFGLTGRESAADIDAHTDTLEIIENMRREAGLRMGLGDVSQKVIPKVSLLSAPQGNGTIHSHYLMPWICHQSHAITGAMCVASSCYLENTITNKVLGTILKKNQTVTVEHPSGVINLDVKLTEDPINKKIYTIGVLRSARPLFEGKVYVMN